MGIPQLTGVGEGLQASTAAAAPRGQTAVPRPPKAAAVPSPEQVQKAVAEIQRVVQPMAQNLQFSIDKTTGKTVVKIIDTSTNEVIRQIPSEEILAIARALDHLQGLLLRSKA
jgi:flagellar protein FlaG